MGLCFREPLFSIFGIRPETVRNAWNLSGIGDGKILVQAVGHEMTGSIERIYPGLSECSTHISDRLLQCLQIIVTHTLTPFCKSLKILLTIYHILVQSFGLDQSTMLFTLQSHGYVLQEKIQLIALSLFNLRYRIISQPFKFFLILLPAGHRIKYPVYTLRYERVPVKFHLIRRKLSDLTGECLQGLLEEPVYGTYCKSAVIMQDIA